MTKKERIDAALTGKIPDRVPFVPKIWIDLAANLAGVDLVQTIQDPLAVLRVIVNVGLDLGIDAVRQFHFPVRSIAIESGIAYDVRPDGSKRGTVDIQGGLHTRLSDADEFELEDPHYAAFHHYYDADSPFVNSLDEARSIHVPAKTYYEEIGCGDRQRQILGEVGDRLPFFGDCSSATLAFYVCMRKMDRALMDLLQEPELVHAVMEKGVAIAVEKGKFNIDLGLKILRLNDSVGNMSVISPHHWREFIFPHMKDACDELHAYDPEVKIYCHICGNVLPILDDLILTGLDCIAPLDPLGKFTCAQAREAAGENAALMGGINTLSFLESKPADIKEEAKRCMREAGMNGAFILGSGCVIPRNAKRESLVAVMEAVRQYGVYYGGVLADD